LGVLEGDGLVEILGVATVDVIQAALCILSGVEGNFFHGPGGRDRGPDQPGNYERKGENDEIYGPLEIYHNIPLQVGLK
jgi:hypothetical protein